MVKTDTIYPVLVVQDKCPLTAVRALALHAQNLTTPLGAEPTSTPGVCHRAADAIYNVVEEILMSLNN